MLPGPHRCTASPIFDILHQSGTFVTTDEPTVKHHYHPRSVDYIRVHSWLCTFYGLGQMYQYKDMYPSLWYHAQYISCPKKSSVLCLFIPPYPLSPGNLCLHSSAFSRKSYLRNSTVCSLFRLASFT